MANYLVWHGKKRATFLRREEEFLRLRNDGGPTEKLRRAAVVLRDARIRYLRSEYSRLDYGDGRHSDQLTKLQTEIAKLTTMPIEFFTDEYRLDNRDDQSPTHQSDQ